MCPVMRFDPYTGKPLTKEGELPRPPIEPKVERSQPEAPATPIVKITDPEVKINPFTPDNRPNIQPLVSEVNKLLEAAEDMLRVRTSNFKLKSEIVPQQFEYKPTITRENSGKEGFKLNRPESPLKAVGKTVNKDIVIDRVFLQPSDLQDLIKNENVAREALITLVGQMYENLVKIKNLDENKTYYGTSIATISKPGQPGKFCSEYQEEFVEIRLFSDVVELNQEGEVSNVVERRNSIPSQPSEDTETITISGN